MANEVPTTIKEATVSDTWDTDFTTTTAVVGTTASELKIGASVLSGRKAVMFQLISTGYVDYGHASDTTPFRAYQYQIVILPIGDDVSIFLKGSSAARNVAIGEMS